MIVWMCGTRSPFLDPSPVLVPPLLPLSCSFSLSFESPPNFPSSRPSPSPSHSPSSSSFSSACAWPSSSPPPAPLPFTSPYPFPYLCPSSCFFCLPYPVRIRRTCNHAAWSHNSANTLHFCFRGIKHSMEASRHSFPRRCLQYTLVLLCGTCGYIANTILKRSVTEMLKVLAASPAEGHLI